MGRMVGSQDHPPPPHNREARRRDLNVLVYLFIARNQKKKKKTAQIPAASKSQDIYKVRVTTLRVVVLFAFCCQLIVVDYVALLQTGLRSHLLCMSGTGYEVPSGINSEIIKLGRTRETKYTYSQVQLLAVVLTTKYLRADLDRTVFRG